MSELIHCEVRDGVQTVEIRRPEKKNALTEAMYRALAEAFERAESEPAVRVIFIRGQPGVFTAGNDIGDFLANPPATEKDPVSLFLRNIIHASKPMVAAVTGAAVGIGTTMLLHCDYVVAGEGAAFSVPFVNLGLCPEAGSSLMLPFAIGYKRAAEMLLFGERIDAAKALDWGLVNQVVPDDRAIETGLARARALAAKPAQALWVTKSLMKRRLAPLAAQAMLEEGHEFHRLLQSPAAREALSAFAEKRAPNTALFT